jgi:hypothetical protein
MKFMTSTTSLFFPAHISLVMDSEMPLEDLHLLRYVHLEYSGVADSILSCWMQACWNEYGPTFTNGGDAVRFASLAWACDRSPYDSIRGGLIDVSKAVSQISRYLSCFNKTLSAALQKECVTESHLFALYLVWLTCGRFPHFELEPRVYMDGFFEVLQFLLNTKGDSGLSSMWVPLFSALRWVLTENGEDLPKGIRWYFQLQSHDIAMTTPSVISNDTKTVLFMGWRFGTEWVITQGLLAQCKNIQLSLIVCWTKLLYDRNSATLLQLEHDATVIEQQIKQLQADPDVSKYFSSVSPVCQLSLTIA